jgi:hypothetical protein
MAIKCEMTCCEMAGSKVEVSWHSLPPYYYEGFGIWIWDLINSQFIQRIPLVEEGSQFLRAGHYGYFSISPPKIFHWLPSRCNKVEHMKTMGRRRTYGCRLPPHHAHHRSPLHSRDRGASSMLFIRVEIMLCLVSLSMARWLGL